MTRQKEALLKQLMAHNKNMESPYVNRLNKKLVVRRERKAGLIGKRVMESIGKSIKMHYNQRPRNCSMIGNNIS